MAAKSERRSPGLTREAILAADDRRVEPVDCPEWGGTVYVRELTAGDVIAWGELAPARDAEPGARARWTADLVARAACDANGERLFTADDVETLLERNGAVIERLFSRALDLNGGRAGDAEKN